MKAIWTEYDKKLSENLKLNEELLKRMNLEKSKKELKTPIYWEISSAAIMFLLFMLMMFYGFHILNLSIYSVLSFLSAALALTCMIFSIKKINAFLKIDYYRTPILQLQKEITSLKIYITKFHKMEMILSGILILTAFPTLMMWVHGFDMFTFNNIIDPIIRIIVIFAIGYPLAIWMNKHFFYKKIENAQYYLDEIERFEKDEEKSK